MGAKPISDKKRKLIVADYVACQNYSEVARKYGISANGVKKIVQRDPASAELFEQKQLESTQSVMEYMENNAETTTRLLGKLLHGMEVKADDIDMFTNIKDLATAYGIIVDKAFKMAEIKQVRENTGAAIEIIMRREE